MGVNYTYFAFLGFHLKENSVLDLLPDFHLCNNELDRTCTCLLIFAASSDALYAFHTLVSGFFFNTKFSRYSGTCLGSSVKKIYKVIVVNQ